MTNKEKQAIVNAVRRLASLARSTEAAGFKNWSAEIHGLRLSLEALVDVTDFHLPPKLRIPAAGREKGEK